MCSTCPHYTDFANFWYGDTTLPTTIETIQTLKLLISTSYLLLFGSFLDHASICEAEKHLG